MYLHVGVERTEKVCVGSGIGYVSCDQDRIYPTLVGKSPQCFQLFFQGKMLSFS